MKVFMTSLHAQLSKKIAHGVHTNPNLKQLGLRFVSTADVETIKDYRKIVVVRNPMDRFLSAFHDKLHDENKARTKLKAKAHDTNKSM